MSSTFEIHREGEVNYSKPLARALLRDSRLSFGARGLFAYLWDLPSGWRTNSAHLSTVSPLGRDGVRTLIKELEKVGAMRLEVIRDVHGRMAGKRWVLVSPVGWAIESPLSVVKNDNSTEGRDFRLSEKPTVGESNTKVHQSKGSSIKSTTVQMEEIGDFVNAAVWASKNGGGKILNEAGFRRTVRTRIQTSGASPEDKQSLLAWRADQMAISERNRVKQQMIDQELGKKMSSVAKTAEIDNAISYFESLGKFKRDAILDEFSTHMRVQNSAVFGFFRESGIKTKIVRTELARFIADVR